MALLRICVITLLGLVLLASAEPASATRAANEGPAQCAAPQCIGAQQAIEMTGRIQVAYSDIPAPPKTRPKSRRKVTSPSQFLCTHGQWNGSGPKCPNKQHGCGVCAAGGLSGYPKCDQRILSRFS